MFCFFYIFFMFVFYSSAFLVHFERTVVRLLWQCVSLPRVNPAAWVCQIVESWIVESIISVCLTMALNNWNKLETPTYSC